MKSPGAIGTTILVTVVIIIIASTIGIVVLGSQGTSWSRSTTSIINTSKTSVNTNSSSGFTPQVSIPLWHEVCGTGTGTESNTVCSTSSPSSAAVVGVPQTFNMTSVVNFGGSNTTTVYEHFFGVQLNQSGTLQFSVGDLYGVSFMVYFNNAQGASTMALANDVVNDRPSVLVNESFGVQYFSGQIDAKSGGLYIFTFSVQRPQTGVSVNFLLRDAAAYGNGISMSIGARTDLHANSTFGTSFQGLEEWAVTVYSNTTMDVNMSTAMVPLNMWAKFVPSYLPDVGPNGATTTLLIAGAIKPHVPNQYNVSIFMDATGSTGSEGESYLPVEPVLPVQVLHAPGPINSQIEVNGANTLLTIGQGGTVNYGVLYDPASESDAGSVSVTLRVTGILEDGEVEALPAWLVVNQPEPTFQLPANEPYYFGFNVTLSSTAPVGGVPLALAETINGQSFSGSVVILVEPPMFG